MSKKRALTCERCGRTSHTIKECYASIHIEGHGLNSADEDSTQDEQSEDESYEEESTEESDEEESEEESDEDESDESV